MLQSVFSKPPHLGHGSQQDEEEKSFPGHAAAPVICAVLFSGSHKYSISLISGRGRGMDPLRRDAGCK